MSGKCLYVVVCVIFCSFVTIVVCIVVRLVFMSFSVMLSGLVLMFVVYLMLLNVVCFLTLGVCLCSGCGGCCVFV